MNKWRVWFSSQSEEEELRYQAYKSRLLFEMRRYAEKKAAKEEANHEQALNEAMGVGGQG